MSEKLVFEIPMFFFASDLVPFSNGNYSRNSSGFFTQNGGQSHQSQIDLLSFLKNIKYKTKFTLLTDTKILNRFTCLFHHFCRTALVYKFHLARKRQ